MMPKQLFLLTLLLSLLFCPQVFSAPDSKPRPTSHKVVSKKTPPSDPLRQKLKEQSDLLRRENRVKEDIRTQSDVRRSNLDKVENNQKQKSYIQLKGENSGKKTLHSTDSGTPGSLPVANP